MVLNETVSNPIDNITSHNVNDYIYDKIYIKNKKSTYININKHKKFIKKHISNTNDKLTHQTSKLYNQEDIISELKMLNCVIND